MSTINKIIFIGFFGNIIRESRQSDFPVLPLNLVYCFVLIVAYTRIHFTLPSAVLSFMTTLPCIGDGSPQFNYKVIGEAKGFQVGGVNCFSKVHRVGFVAAKIPNLCR